MRIAIIVNAMVRAGAERQVFYAVRELALRGHDVELIYYHKAEHEYDLSALGDATVTFLPKNRGSILFLIRLQRHLKRRRFDVVHAFKGTENIYGCLAARWAGVPVILGGYRVEYRARGVIRWAHRMLRRIVDGWIVNAQAIADSMVEAIDAKPEDFFVLFNGVETTAFASQLSPTEARHKLGLDPTTPVVTTVARLHPQKNHAMFLRMASCVLKRRPETRFLVVGDGPERAFVHEKARSMGLMESVLFLGDRPDVPDLLAATDVSVLTSNFEGLANALVESMCAGVPTVTTDYSGVEEVVIDGQEGYVVPCGDAEVMAEKVCQLLGDEALRKQMGQRGVETVAQRFSIETMTDRLLSIYDRCLSKQRRPST